MSDQSGDAAQPSEISWPADMDHQERAEFEAMLKAFDKAVDAFETDHTVVYGSESERQRDFHGFLDEWRKNWSKPGTCMYEGCSNKSISRSHTIALSASIRQIAEDGHVLTPKFGRSGIELVPIGVKQASTFPGFCTAHERLFAEFESKKSLTRKEDYLLQGFRTICREIYSKSHQAQQMEAMLAEYCARRRAFILDQTNATLGEGVTPKSLTFENDQMETRLTNHLATSRESLADLRVLYDGLLKEIQGSDDQLEMVVISLDYELPLCLSGFGMLNYRADGNESTQHALCFLIVLPEDNATKVIIGAAKDHGAAVQMHASPDSPFALLAMLESWMIHGTDHWFLRPSAWSTIPERRRAMICEAFFDMLSLADAVPVSILDGPRLALIEEAERQIRSGAINAEQRAVVEAWLIAERSKLASPA